MIDISHLTSIDTAQIFYANKASWQVWKKPSEAKLVYIFLLGGGGDVEVETVL